MVENVHHENPSNRQNPGSDNDAVPWENGAFGTL
jgi:hypothetical protein